MSRIGRMPVAIPAGVTVTIAENNNVTVKGPKGTLVRDLPVEMEIKEEEPENAEASIVVTESGTETKDSDLHIEKDQSLITVIELGSDIVDKESQN